jgi:hypothetical protein
MVLVPGGLEDRHGSEEVGIDPASAVVGSCDEERRRLLVYL